MEILTLMSQRTGPVFALVKKKSIYTRTIFIYTEGVFYVKCIYVVGTCVVWTLYIYTFFSIQNTCTLRLLKHVGCSIQMKT